MLHGADFSMLPTATTIALVLMAAAIGLSLYRIVKGPTLPDRVIALDLAGSVCAALLAAGAIALRQPLLLDVLLGLAMILFFSSTVFARYLARQREEEES